MMNRVRAGFCTVPNPFNRKQVSRLLLLPSDVDAVVFWTRNSTPLMRHLGEMDSLGLRYYFQFTILGYPREIDPKCPSLEGAVRAFQKLSDHVGPKRVVWRYDPIVFSKKTPPEYHKRRFAEIAGELNGHTNRAVVSIVDDYRKAEPRMAALEGKGVGTIDVEATEFGLLMRDLANLAGENGMDITSCAEEIDLSRHGIRPGKCVDDELIADAFGIDVPTKKDPSQRKACGCVVSRDIGMYDSCVFGCPYCYATGSLDRAEKNHREHDPQSPSLLGWYEPKTQSATT
jgi:hypothetical protein